MFRCDVIYAIAMSQLTSTLVKSKLLGWPTTVLLKLLLEALPTLYRSSDMFLRFGMFYR